jgi:hypothetical protein
LRDYYTKTLLLASHDAPGPHLCTFLKDPVFSIVERFPTSPETSSFPKGGLLPHL